jgi:hypothetical protein
VQRLSIRHLLIALLLPLLLASAATAACYWAAGPTLGLFLGSVAVAALLSPALICGPDTVGGRVMAGAGVVHGIVIVLLVAVFRSDTTLGQWAECYLLLAAFVVALGGLVVALRGLRLNPVAAAALTTTLALAWLTWPIWLAPHLNGTPGQRIVSWVVPAHPLFAMNAVVAVNAGIWDEQTLMYFLSNFPDLLYPLPHGVWAAAALHAAGGIVLMLFTWFFLRIRVRRAPGLPRPGPAPAR